MILILNAPAGCGKDTIANILAHSRLNFSTHSFKKPMFDIALAMSGISKDEWFERYNDRERKERPWGKLGCLSQRQFMIKISEDFIKPIFGNQHFGELAAVDCMPAIQAGKHVVFSDGGFVDEVMALCNVYGSENVKVIRLHREGYTFEGDSRSYLHPKFCEAIDITLVEGEPEEAAFWLCRYVSAVSDIK